MVSTSNRSFLFSLVTEKQYMHKLHSKVEWEPPYSLFPMPRTVAYGRRAALYFVVLYQRSSKLPLIVSQRWGMRLALHYSMLIITSTVSRMKHQSRCIIHILSGSNVHSSWISLNRCLCTRECTRIKYKVIV